MQSSRGPIEIFCSYDPSDEQFRRELEMHLSLLRRQGWLSLWHNRHILPGTDWAYTIDTHLDLASLILLLVSPAFFASDYCYGIEMRRALERDKANEARVIPILVRPVDLTGAPFLHLQVLPTKARPITKWRNRDEAFATITAGIRQAIENLYNPSESISSILRSSPEDVDFFPRLPSLVSPLLQSGALPSDNPQFADAFPAIWNVPLRHKEYFIGREHVLQQIHETFRQTSISNSIIALVGPGGMGKTQTAAEYAYRHRSDYESVLWLKAESITTLTLDVLVVADLLNLPKAAMHDQQQIIIGVMAWLRTHPHWLLIFDNADDLFTINDFLPLAGSGHILLTTRALSLGGIARQGIVLDKLSAEAGALFLLRRATIIDASASYEAITEEKYTLAQTISERLGGLPLALDQAGAYIEDTACSLSRYLTLYQTRSSEIQRMRFGPAPDYPEAVATAWTLSRALVEASNPAASDLLRFCAFLYPEAIPEILLIEGASELGPRLKSVATDPVKLDLTMRELRKYSLLSRDADTGTISMHRLLQDVQRAELSQEEQYIWAERAVRAVNVVIHNLLPSSQRLFVQAKTCVTLIQQWNMQFPEAKLLQQWMEKQTL